MRHAARDLLACELIQGEIDKLRAGLQVANAVFIESDGVSLCRFRAANERQEIISRNFANVGIGFFSRIPTSPLASEARWAA